MRSTLKTSGASSSEEDKANQAAVIEALKGKVFGVLVSAATFYENEILLLRRSMSQTFMPGAWSIPAGKIQPLEDLQEAVLRELEEEGGIEGVVLGSLGMTWFESIYHNQPLHHIQFNFVVEANSREVELRDKSNMDYMWLPIDNIKEPPVKIDEFTRVLVEKAVDRYTAIANELRDQ